MQKKTFVGFVLLLLISPSSYAWFFLFPIPNLNPPPQLQNLIDALEKSPETKAVAYVREDKTFGAKYWVWGHYVGKVSQEEANQRALKVCEAGLTRARAQTAGGQPLYDFGDRRCELHDFSFSSNAQNPNDPVARQPAVPPQPAKSSDVPVGSPDSSRTSDIPSSAVQPVKNVNAQGTINDSPAAKKLKELKSLFEQGLITKEEYEEKRRVVLQGL